MSSHVAGATARTGNILLSGGNSVYKGMDKRLSREVSYVANVRGGW